MTVKRCLHKSIILINQTEVLHILDMRNIWFLNWRVFFPKKNWQKKKKTSYIHWSKLISFYSFHISNYTLKISQWSATLESMQIKCPYMANHPHLGRDSLTSILSQTLQFSSIWNLNLFSNSEQDHWKGRGEIL